jgi:hypothetical protein
VNNWKELFQSYQQWETNVQERKDRQLQSEANMQALELWYEQTTDSLMNRLYQLAQERAKEFEANTNAHVTLIFPHHSPIISMMGETSVSVISSQIGPSEVHLYSHRKRNSPPYLHLASISTAKSAESAKTKLRTMVPISGCKLERTGENDYQLIRIRDASESPAEPEEITLEQLIFRNFELLVLGLKM